MTKQSPGVLSLNLKFGEMAGHWRAYEPISSDPVDSTNRAAAKILIDADCGFFIFQLSGGVIPTLAVMTRVELAAVHAAIEQLLTSKDES